MITKTGSIIAKNLYESKSGSTMTVNGALVIDGGIASSFSNTAYISTPYSQENVVTDLEIFVEVITPIEFPSSDSRYIVIGQDGANFKSPQIEVHATRVGYGLSTNQSGWSGNWNIAYNFQTSTRYGIKLTFKDNVAKLYVNDYLLNTTTINSGIYYTVPIRIGADTNGDYSWCGSVDLTKTYIKVGNNVWSGLDAYLQNNTAKIGKDFVASDTFYEY
jgi:hypothetical protein